VLLSLIELWYVRHNQKTISQHAQEFVHSWGPAGALIGFVAGWFLCHITP
jgi:hypothetical protein